MSDTEKPAKPVKPAKPYQHRLTPTDCLVLDRLCGVLKEQARVYRLVLNRHIDSQTGARLHFMLANIRTTIETIMDRERELPPPQLEAPIVITTVPSDCYLSAEQIQEIKKREFNNSYGNGHDDDNGGKLN